MKLKTNKSLKKRLKVTKRRNFMIRRGRQNKFNAKDSGNITRRKRKDKKVVKELAKMLKINSELPYSY
ncbi:MAG: hypothetical protein US76_00960 [Parcubacteria group bacterium GW2011_GWA2_38_13b]|nr:MAG: hypothetical protein US76_00960 [Parcubacteria group bacterium GW2011_GWA2_38_13b]